MRVARFKMSTTHPTTLGYDDARRFAIETFARAYNTISAQAARAENENSVAACDLHIRLSTMLTDFLRKYNDLLSPRETAFLRSETVARCMQALLLRSMELSGFGDMSLSLHATRKLNEDIERARKRLEEGRGSGGDEGDDTSDPRTVTNGLYEYIPFEQLDVSLKDLPGYETQHRQLTNAYFIIDTAATNSASNDDTQRSSSGDNAITDEELAAVDGRTPQTRAGANAILYGPPGTGKTVAARAVAASHRLDFVFVNAENLLSAYRSETEKNLRTLYAKMRLLIKTTGRNVVLLLDEVDGLVKNRTAAGGISSGDYSLLTRFLTILEPNDGSDNHGIFSVFTTNHLSNLDDAFRRRCVSVFFGPVAAKESRIRLFHKFLNDTVTTEPGEDDELIARSTVAWVPGDYARFKRDVAKPMQLDEYLRRRHLTLDEFYDSYAKRAHHDGAAGRRGDDRRILLDLPLLSYRDDRLRDAIVNYRPVTPLERYTEDYPEQRVLDRIEI